MQDGSGSLEKNGGERGIRTLGTAVGSTRDFQSRSFGQLGHLSATAHIPQFPAGSASCFLVLRVHAERYPVEVASNQLYCQTATRLSRFWNSQIARCRTPCLHWMADLGRELRSFGHLAITSFLSAGDCPCRWARAPVDVHFQAQREVLANHPR